MFSASISNDVVYVAEYYEVEEKKEKVFIYRDPLTGEPVSYYQQDIKDVIDDLANRGFIKVAERKVKRRRVYKSIITCMQILKDREKISERIEKLPAIHAAGCKSSSNNTNRAANHPVHYRIWDGNEPGDNWRSGKLRTSYSRL